MLPWFDEVQLLALRMFVVRVRDMMRLTALSIPRSAVFGRSAVNSPPKLTPRILRAPTSPAVDGLMALLSDVVNARGAALLNDLQTSDFVFKIV